MEETGIIEEKGDFTYFRNESGVSLGLKLFKDKKPHVGARRLIDPGDVTMLDDEEIKAYRLEILSGGLVKLTPSEVKKYVKTEGALAIQKQKNVPKLSANVIRNSDLDDILSGTVAEVKEYVANTDDIRILKSLWNRERVLNNGGRKGVISVVKSKIASSSTGILVGNIE